MAPRTKGRWEEPPARLDLGAKVSQLQQEQRDLELELQKQRLADAPATPAATAAAGHRIMRGLGEHVEKNMAKLSTCFAAIDADNSGALDRCEWARFLEATGFVVPVRSPANVAGGADSATPEEDEELALLTHRSPTAAEVEAAWSLLDLDADGAVSAEDFLGAMRRERTARREHTAARVTPAPAPHPAAAALTPAEPGESLALTTVNHAIAAACVSGLCWAPQPKVLRALTSWLTDHVELCA